MNDKQQKTETEHQLFFAFATACGDEVPGSCAQGSVSSTVDSRTESLANENEMMERICDPLNLDIAMARVIANDGSPGVDGMRVQQLEAYFQIHGARIVSELLAGTYRPQPVKRLEIPKPGGGVRKLGIPTAVDRVIQQAILLVLSPEWDPTFSDHSFGFRPNRSTHDAVRRAQSHLNDGYTWVVDMDLEKFFDRVNHDVLMSRVARRIKDKRLLKLLRAFLNSGVLDKGLFSDTHEGTPQGGPLSPLLSNLLLDEFDRELTARGLRFVRYADDCNIYVRSSRAGARVLTSVTQWLAKHLRLTVNQQKSAVDRPWNRKFLGYTFTQSNRITISPQSEKKFKARIRQLTKRNSGKSTKRMISEIRSYVLGWRAYFRFDETVTTRRALDGWLRRRVRSYHWKQWKTGPSRLRNLLSLGVSAKQAVTHAWSTKGCWRMGHCKALQVALSNRVLEGLGLPSLLPRPAPLA